MTEFYICIQSDQRSPNFEVWDGPFKTMDVLKDSESYKAIVEQLTHGDAAVRDMFYLKLTPGEMPYIGDF